MDRSLKPGPLLERELDFVSREARTMVLDSLYCTLHNHANDLAGNTAETDLEWFAAKLWEWRTHKPGFHWEQVLTDEEREEWRETARVALEVLPLLMSKIESRCRAYAQAIQTLLAAERKAEKVAQARAIEELRQRMNRPVSAEDDQDDPWGMDEA